MSESRIRELSTERAGRISRLAFDEMVRAFYAADATLMPSGEGTVRGIDAIAAFWRSTPENGLVSLTLETREVQVSGDLAFEIGHFDRTLRPRHGPPFQESGKYVVIYRRAAEDDWRAVAEMFNSDARR
ncbi:MAG: DUF4440 domain-containing protein [Gemmatimonadetes bacterium]|nr:DUF4440 domain-containing protein [Gemmatimonadota bacterium]